MHYIVKIKNGNPVIFSVAGKRTTAPVYVFEEEEAYDAALEAGMIPIGAVVMKTYDKTEMAGGPFDDALSFESDNALQNLVVAAEVARLDDAIASAIALRATLTGFGLGKICPTNVTDVTEDNGLVLGAKEKNPSISGTLGNLIKKNTDAFAWKTAYENVVAENVTGLRNFVGNGTKEFYVMVIPPPGYRISFVFRGDIPWVELRHVDVHSSASFEFRFDTWNEMQQVFATGVGGYDTSEIKFYIYYR